MPRAGRERALQQEAVGRMAAGLVGSMRAVRTIKAARAERAHAEAVMEDAERARDHGFRAGWTEVIGYEVGFSGMLAVTVFMLAFGAWRVYSGALTIGALVAFVMYTQNFMMPLMQMADGFSTIQSGLAASKRIAEAQEIEFEEPSSVPDDDASATPAEGVPVAGPLGAPEPALPVEVADGIPVLAFENVTARYKPTEPEVLRDVSLTIPRRGHVAIVGPSGAGKSSTISLALRFLSPTSGSILLDGVPYESLTYAQVRQRFAFVEQDPPVLPGTVHDNLEPANFEHSDAELHAVLSEVGLDEDISAMEDGFDTELVGATMTGGGRQRLAIARALLAGAEVLLLDDATSQIGGPVADSIGRAIRAAAERGAVVTIGNRLSTVRGADKIYVLDEGRVVAEGTHASLSTASDLYRGLVTAN
jgi:ATP-binding cassette subfamily B protein